MKLINILLVFCSIMGSSISMAAQAPEKWTSSEIQERIKKLQFLGSVLYVAAHPDDENTRLISYLANEKNAETAYLSLTRGDGGQNLIGTEIRELLGVLRTQELLSARKIDGGKQFFTRANDFGYSKHPDETFEIWNKEEVLKDVIMTIRKFQPDIIVNRFNHKTPGTTHGHHTGSAMLGLEGFEKSADKTIYPDQLDRFEAFQAQRIFFNTSSWFYRDDSEWETIKKDLYTADIGVYYPLKGKSNTEIAAESRSQHKCQGFGSAGTRGEREEYLELIGGSTPSNREDIFSGINTTWSRLKGGEVVGVMVKGIDQNFDPLVPAKSVSALTMVYMEIQTLPESVWKERKLAECRDLILACSGFYLDVFTDERFTTAGDQVDFKIEAINRVPKQWTMNRGEPQWILKTVKSNVPGVDTMYNLNLGNNIDHIFSHSVNIPYNMDYSTAYWLRKKGTLGMYAVEQDDWIGLPQTPDPVILTFEFEVEGITLEVERPLVFKKSDPVKAEVYDPFEILPPVFVESKEETIIFRPGQSHVVRVEITAGTDDVKGTLIPVYGDSWKIEPTEVAFELDSKNQKKYYEFKLTAPTTQDVNKLAFMAKVNDNYYIDKLVTIDYDHIPTQLILQDNSVNTISIDIKSVGNQVAYIMGAGDKVPDALRAIGYAVDEIAEEDIRPEILHKYPAVIVGIRAYNVMDNMKFHHSTLMEYVNKGGTVVIQYNTRHRLKSDDVGPYPIKLSRKRVTDEYAEVKILKKDHPILNYPNKITTADFDGWVQERGLYFPEEWDDRYETIISSKDKGEEDLEGGLLVTTYGDGHFVYTGYSFFRELPAGVPGAYRLFANLISYGQKDRP